MARERDNLKQVASNLDGEYAHRACCVLGVRGGLIKDDRTSAAALTQAVRNTAPLGALRMTIEHATIIIGGLQRGRARLGG